MPITTPLTSLLGITHPILSAPMDVIAGARLTAAVSEAGGFGILGGGYGEKAWLEQETAELKKCRQPFGIGFITWSMAKQPALLDIALAARPRAIMSSFGDPKPHASRIRAAGSLLICQVQNEDMAKQALDAGADILIAQGTEAGGHGASRTLIDIVPAIIDLAAGRVPVVAAGGIADARGVVAVLALGAQAAVLGTRFLASAESRAHPHYKQRVLAANEEDTVRTILFGHGWPNAPHRTLRTAFVQQWLGQEGRGQESRPDEPVVGQTVIGGQPMPVLRFMGFPPNAEASGDIDAMDLLAGQGIGLVREVKPAGQIVRELVEEAHHIISQRLAGRSICQTL